MAEKKRANKSTAKKAPVEPPPAPRASWQKPPPQPRAKVRSLQIATTAPQPLIRPWPASRVLVKSRVIGAILVAAIVLAGLLSLLTSGLFRVSPQTTRISGNQRVTTEQIYAASGVDNRNIFAVHGGAIAAAVGKMPGIAAANAHVSLPAQVYIEVRELEPLAIYQVLTRTLWIAADGSTMAAVGDPPLLTLKDATGSALADRKKVRVTVAANLKTLHDTRPELREIYYGALEGLYFRAPQGWTVYLGDDGRLADKLDLLMAVEHGILAGTIARPEVVDLRFGGQAQLR